MSRVWFITGINSGFGRCLAEQVLGRGDRVAGTVRTPGAVDDLLARFPAALHVDLLDVTDTDRVYRVVDSAVEHFGRLDVVVNNAGYGLFGTAEEVTPAQITRIVDTNLIGSIHVARAALPHLRSQGAGRIVQVSSYGGQATNPGAGMYHATKWGIEGFLESLAEDVRPLGIGVTIVEPGGARTEFRFGSLELAAPMSAYDSTPAAMVRGAKDRSRPPLGDPALMAARIIDSVGQESAPLRLVLGSDSYRFLHAALTARLADVDAQRSSAEETDCSES